MHEKPAPPGAHAFRPATRTLLQRKCACSASSGLSGQCEECGRKKIAVQRKASGAAENSAVPPIVGEVLNSPGQPLDAHTRSLMESRLGHDFSRVRVHTDARAVESAHAVGAAAYTVGRDIVFREGQYAPHTKSGRELLAHELAHVVQQRGETSATAGAPLRIAEPESGPEREADRAAALIGAGHAARVSRGAAIGGVQMMPWGACPAGRRVPAKFPYYAWAETHMLIHYRMQRGEPGVFTNENLPEEVTYDAPGELSIQDQILAGFVGKKRRGRKRPGKTDTFPSGSAEGEDLNIARQTAERLHYLLRPDIMDSNTGEIYDVTTIGQAKRKASKIRKYVAQATESSDIEWKAGTTLPPPEPTMLSFDAGPNVICFGPTDFADSPGVLAYEVIEKPGKRKSDEKKKGEEEKKKGASQTESDTAKKAPAEPEAGDAKAKKPVPDVSDAKSLRKEARGVTRGVRQAKKQATETVTRELSQRVASASSGEVIVYAFKSPVQRFLQKQFPKIIGERLIRLAETRAVKRAASYIPVLGWGFAAVDAYYGLVDIYNGHYLRGLAGVSCATADVASDAVHVGDVATGVGGTVASVALQAGTTACQIAIEVERAKDLMAELQLEIEKNEALPTDERMRAYYDLDDVAIRELKSEFPIKKLLR